ncbi:G-protein coupled receptor moody-like isoform X2 [Anneissia japonica]|nr:G-protein coupled receptor moody-like isoform X2 [Anneissia japonica]
MIFTTDNADTEMKNVGLVIFECAILSCMLILGSIGNTLTIIAVLTNRGLREPGHYLVVNLAIADLIPCLITDSVYIVSAWYREWFLPNAYIACQIIGVLTVLCLNASIMNLTMIAVNRYVCIVKYSRYRTIFTPGRTILICILIWVPPLISVMVPFFNREDVFGFHDVALSCSIEATSEGSRFLTLSLLTFVPLSFTIITFCYVSIFRAVRASRRRIEQWKEQSSQTGTSKRPNGEYTDTREIKVALPRSSKYGLELEKSTGSSSAVVDVNDTVARSNLELQKDHQPPPVDKNDQQSSNEKTTANYNIHAKLNIKKEVRLTMNLFIVFVVFIFCWMPITIAAIVDSDFSAPDALWQSLSIFALANSCCNPIVYGWRSKQFRQSYKEILKCSSCTTTPPID